MNRFAIYLEAYAAELARLAASLTQLHQELSELRDEMRSSLTHDEPETELQEAA